MADKANPAGNPGRAVWTEVSDSYVKARFTCPECKREERLTVEQVLEVGTPHCTCREGQEMDYSGLFAFI